MPEDPTTWWESVPIGDLGAGAIVVAIVFMLLRGLLVTRRVHLDRMADKDAEISRVTADRDKWQSAAEILLGTNHTLADQVSEVMEGVRTQTAVLAALGRAANAPRAEAATGD